MKNTGYLKKTLLVSAEKIDPYTCGFEGFSVWSVAKHTKDPGPRGHKLLKSYSKIQKRAFLGQNQHHPKNYLIGSSLIMFLFIMFSCFRAPTIFLQPIPTTTPRLGVSCYCGWGPLRRLPLGKDAESFCVEGGSVAFGSKGFFVKDVFWGCPLRTAVVGKTRMWKPFES